MDADEMFARCAALRCHLADLLDSLTPAQLRLETPCGSWDVHTVAAHLTVLPAGRRAQFALAMLRQRSFDRANDAMARDAARRDIGEITDLLRAHATSRAVPPVGGPRAPLTDLLVHGADICLPTGQPWVPDMLSLGLALDFLAGRPLGFLPIRRLAGIQLVASDLDRSWRDGAQLRGTAADLVLAVCGRRSSLDRLDGPGLAVLRQRL